jgi:hypothetical protein
MSAVINGRSGICSLMPRGPCADRHRSNRVVPRKIIRPLRGRFLFSGFKAWCLLLSSLMKNAVNTFLFFKTATDIRPEKILKKPVRRLQEQSFKLIGRGI